MSNSQFNINSNKSFITNSNEYYLEKKYVSIHSEDRNIFKYPNASLFEIELPQDYLNVQSVRLISWSFPANYDVFSQFFSNLSMTFKISTPYNPGEHNFADPIAEAIFAGLYFLKDINYVITIQPGFYNPLQMATELTNKFNAAVTLRLIQFFTNNPLYNYALETFTNANGYNRFTIVYDDVAQKLWFGNNADEFILTNDSQLLVQTRNFAECGRMSLLPNKRFIWGLPGYLGFTQCPMTATKSPLGQVPRFFYSNENNGIWLFPSLPKANVYFVEAPLKINFMGPAYFYMEIDGFNCIDETAPWAPSEFTQTTNETNGIVNSAFAKISIPTTPITQWFDQGSPSFKYFNPPAERIRKLRIKLRYHEGDLIEFGNFDYSFMLEFNVLRPQSERKYTIVN
jgi:hypothetical protein